MLDTCQHMVHMHQQFPNSYTLFDLLVHSSGLSVFYQVIQKKNKKNIADE